MDPNPAAALPVESSTMDIDMDLDLGIGAEDGLIADDYGEPNAQAMNIDAGTPAQPAQAIPDIYSEDITSVPAPEKVHVRGLDNLATEDLEAFALEHYPAQRRSRVEWVDDTSANLVYSSADHAAEALIAFSDPSSFNDPNNSAHLQPQHLRPAKPSSAIPAATLQVRQALTTDVKKQRARDASRYYLMNPDKDPANRVRRGGGRPVSRKRRYGEDALADQPFDESMYDDDEATLAARTRRASDSADLRQSKRQRFGAAKTEDLFADRLHRKANAGRELFRARSASPRRDLYMEGDGRFGFDEHALEDAAPRGRTPGNASKELFGDSARGVLRDGNGNAGRELFADNTSRASSPFHRRTDAFDAGDELSSNSPVVQDKHSKPRGLAERITGGPGQSSSPSRNRARNGASRFDPSEDQGSVMRGGAGAADDNPGFSVKGVAKAVNPRVKELFPQKEGANGEAEDLFADKLRGRRANRRKAEDLFG